MQEALTFDDVLIVPKFSDISSRKDVDTSYNGFNIPYMRLPVISSNMDTVTGPEMSRAMINYGAQSCLHRFCSIEDNIKMFRDSCLYETDLLRTPLVSIGLGKEELKRAEALINVGAYSVVIDVANGAQKSVVDQVKALKDLIKDNGSIIVGNFASTQGVKDFIERTGYIAAVKIGIGGGAACTTRVKTGIGYPQFSAIQSISDILHHSGISIIADGGIKTSGDIAKALGAGSHMVMLGSMLAGTHESLGEKVYKARDGKYISFEEACPIKTDSDGTRIYMSEYIDLPAYKKYRGSASKESYEAQGKLGTHRTAEGESFLVPCKGPVKNILQDIEGGLRSSMTYTNSRNLKEFRQNCEFVRVTSAGYAEGLAHGKR